MTAVGQHSDPDGRVLFLAPGRRPAKDQQNEKREKKQFSQAGPASISPASSFSWQKHLYIKKNQIKLTKKSFFFKLGGKIKPGSKKVGSNPTSVDEIVAAFAAAITPRTRIISISHPVFITGLIMPLRELSRLAREKGLLFLAANSSPTANNNYLFNYTTAGTVSAWETMGYNLDADVYSSSSTFLNWTSSSAVNSGLDTYNTFKIVRQGNNYTYCLNNQLITSFTDSCFNPLFLIIGGNCGGYLTTL